jgi:uncharacterized protein (TIGR02118 family)
MAKKAYIHIVTTQCQPKDEAKFNKWYNETHIPMLKQFKGLKRVARYKVTNLDKPQFLAVYHFDSIEDFKTYQASAELKAAIAEMNQSWPTGIEILNRQQCELLAEW